MKDSKTLRERFEERFRNTFSDLTEDSEEDFAYTRLTEDVLSFLESEIALAKKEACEEVIGEIVSYMRSPEFLPYSWAQEKDDVAEMKRVERIKYHLDAHLRSKFLSESPKEV